MITDKALTQVLAMHLYSEGMGEVSDITETTFWIEGQRKNKVEVHSAMLGNKIDFSACCLCCDFTLLSLLDKTGDNVILLPTDKLKAAMVDGHVSLVDMAEFIIYRWAVEFLPASVA
tara:strand:- start:282 stop:632 length:351 start_codon:yes stop_codon:yes gene_type:complete